MQSKDIQKMVNSVIYPTIFVLLLWIVRIVEVAIDADFSVWGIMPLKLNGLIGIVTAPFIHGDWKHLMANTIPVWVLMSTLFYFYRPIAWQVFILGILITGLWVWVWAREAYHIGASGIVYHLTAFLFFSGIFRKDARLMAISFFVIFIYGGLVWGLFPQLFPERNISWESHLTGLLVGFVLAVFYRHDGPKRKVYNWELEENEDDTNDENAYWKIQPKSPKPEQPTPPAINYIYREKEKPNPQNPEEPDHKE